MGGLYSVFLLLVCGFIEHRLYGGLLGMEVVMVMVVVVVNGNAFCGTCFCVFVL